MNQSAGKIEETDSTGRLACLNRKSAWPQTTKVEKLSSLCFSGKLCHRWYTMHVCMCTIVSDMYACVCARECTRYMTVHGQHISVYTYYIHIFVRVYLSLSLCLSVIVCACLIMFIFLPCSISIFRFLIIQPTMQIGFLLHQPFACSSATLAVSDRLCVIISQN